MKIIDAHMHIPQWVRADDKMAFDIMKEYQLKNNIVYVDNMCCSNNGNLWDGYKMDQTILGAIAKLENPTVFTHGCLYIPEDITEISKFNFKSQLEELMELGLDGVKICDFKPDAYKVLNVEKLLKEYEEYISCCEKYNVHMCWHVADPSEFWQEDKVSEEIKKTGWFYGDNSFASYNELISLAYRLIDMHPNLNIMLAHAFFKSFDPDEVVELLDKYPNVSIDLAPGWEMHDGFRTCYEKWYDIFRKYSDRFLYATDASMSSYDSGMDGMAQGVLRFLETDDEFEVPGKHFSRGIKLEQNYLENVLYKNHERIVGKEPRQINKPALKKYIERYLPLMPDSKNRQMTEEYYRKNLL